MKNEMNRPEDLRPEEILPEENQVPAENSLPEAQPAADSDWNNDWNLDVDALIQDFLEVAQEAEGLDLPLFDETEEALVEVPPAKEAESAPAEEPTSEEAEPAPAAEEPAAEAVPAGETKPETASEPSTVPEPTPAEELMTEFIPAHELTEEPAAKEIPLQKPVRQVKRRRRVRKRNFLGYFIAEGVRGIFSHGFMSFAAASIIAVCLLILGSFSLIALNLTENLENVMDKNQFLAYVDENLSEEDARALQYEIEAIDNVTEVTFISREEAMEEFTEDQQDSDLLKDLPDSVLRHRFAVHVEDLELLDDTIEQVRAVDGIEKISADQDLAEKFVMVRNVLLIVAAVLVASLLLVSVFIIFNTIKLATISRQEEIAIMKMCGATNGFVRWPFIYEGAITGLVGAGVSYGLQYAIYMAIENTQMLQLEGLVRIVPWDTVWYYVLGGFLGIGLVIGVLGSIMGIRKFLKV